MVSYSFLFSLNYIFIVFIPTNFIRADFFLCVFIFILFFLIYQNQILKIPIKYFNVFFSNLLIFYDKYIIFLLTQTKNFIYLSTV